MKKYIKIITLFSAVVAALIVIVMPAISPAQDSSAGQTAPAAKKKTVTFQGKVTAVDTNAMTLTVATLNFNITSKTKVSKGGKPATLSEIVVGDAVSGSYKKDDAGKLNVTTIRDGKATKPAKKKKSAAGTNAPAAN